MILSKILKSLDTFIQNPNKGLPEELFLYISTIIPMVNVDLLIQNEKSETLLAWRDDPYCGTGWHIPGGMLRIDETLMNRVNEVIKTEIFTKKIRVEYIRDIIETIIPNLKYRRHGVSIVYQCSMDSCAKLKNENKKENEVGYLKWFSECPENLLECQSQYRKFF